ncbi:MAG TPA: hypothetical protein VMF03_08040 [Steroidobacteraceae bacterium]|nr:hypothetical protein [Steroidobacteraceae bacterium]
MKSHAFGALLCLTGAALACSTLASSGRAYAELVVEDGKVAVAPANVPQPARGSLMKTVEKQFGPPTTRHPTVGKPPITRWDYPNFSVFFEGDRVIDSVATGS